MQQVVTTDQMGFEITYPIQPKSIVSLVPSQTELLFDLGLSTEITGITKFCIHPKQQINIKPKIGGTKNFRFDQIDDINPDLIIGNKEENYEDGITKLKEKYPVWMSDVFNLTDALNMIVGVSQLVGKQDKGEQITESIKREFNKVEIKSARRVLYFIWKKPYMVAGKHTFINEMLNIIGLENAIEAERYPEVTEDDIKRISPDLILLSSEPFPFKAAHFNDFKAICPQAAIHVVDGEMFSWYGSRLMKAPTYFNSLSF